MGLFDKMLAKSGAEGGAAEPSETPQVADGDREAGRPRESPLPVVAQGSDSELAEGPTTEVADKIDQVLGGVDEELLVEEDLDGDDETDAASAADSEDDLLDIFTSEEEDDMDLSALTSSLEEVGVESLLVHAREVLEELKIALHGG